MTRAFRLIAPAVAALSLALLGAAGARADEQRPAGVRLEMTDEMGPVLADPRGLTLYTWSGDRKAGESLCGDVKYDHNIGAGSVSYQLPEPETRPTCAQIWPPFLAAADAKPVGDWTLVVRQDGKRQWARKGKPLYTFVEDRQPGEINGLDGQAGRFLAGRAPAWASLGAPPGLAAYNTIAGRVLITDKGKTLYVKKGGVTKASACRGACDEFKPLAAPAMVQPPKDWTVVTLADGARQWAFQGQPLYTYAGDGRFAELNGADEPGWAPAVLQKPLPPPSELTIQVTADGEAYADRNGMTVYSWGCSDEAVDRALCDIPGASQVNRRSICGTPEVCIKTWRPVVASAGAKPVGRTWSIVTIDPTGAYQYAAPGQKGGLRVWAYRGRPIYTFAGDKEPGDMNGDTLTSGFKWGYGMVRADGRRSAF